MQWEQGSGDELSVAAASEGNRFRSIHSSGWSGTGVRVRLGFSGISIEGLGSGYLAVRSFGIPNRALNILVLVFQLLYIELNILRSWRIPITFLHPVKRHLQGAGFLPPSSYRVDGSQCSTGLSGDLVGAGEGDGQFPVVQLAGEKPDQFPGFTASRSSPYLRIVGIRARQRCS